VNIVSPPGRESAGDIYLDALRAAGLEPLAISALDGSGLETLRAAIARELEALGMVSEEGSHPSPPQPVEAEGAPVSEETGNS
jgi:hypothetical protein